MMVQYRFAMRTDGTVADAQDLSSQKPGDCGSEFLCLGCERQLIARVHGSKRSPHFAHHPGTACSPETYLHRLGKEVFAQVFKECVATGTPFEIELQHPLVCRRFEESMGSPCVLGRFCPKVYDLTKYCRHVKTEERDGAFVPDLLLTSSSNPKNRIYIEIAVTHVLSETKESSDHKIIEIQLATENDVEVIRSRRLTQQNARFVNFSIETQAIGDSECQSANQQAFALIIYDSGKCFLETSTLRELALKRTNLSERIKYFRITDHRGAMCGSEYPFSPGGVFRDAIEQAFLEGVSLKNCYLCRYHALTSINNPSFTVFCKCFGQKCSTNEAVSCSAFRLFPPESHGHPTGPSQEP